MEGKTITKVLELESGYSALLLDDEEVAIVKIITPDLSLDELRDFVGSEPAAKSEKVSETKKEKKPEKKEEKKKEEDYTWDELENMTFEELGELCDEQNLVVDPADFDKDEVDDLRKDIAEEMVIKAPKEKKEPKEEKKKEEKKDDDYTWDDLKEMDFDELEKLCDEEDTKVDPNDYDDNEEDTFRRAIAEEFGIIPPRPRRKK